MRFCTVDFRGEQMDVTIDHDSGYEPDTNAHDIDWHFTGMDAAAHDALQITPEEDQAIYDELCQLGPEYFDDDVF